MTPEQALAHANPPCALPGSALDHASAGLDACVHCGFCLPACPTYLALEDENDSPRGRVVLMRALLDGRADPTDADVHRHLDQCLGCRGCESACPSGVPYGELLEATRETLAEHRPLPLVARLVLAVFAREWLLRPALLAARLFRDSGLARLGARVLPQRLAMPLAMLASTARPRSSETSVAGAATPADGDAVAVLTGCVMEGLFNDANRATERVLARAGWRLASAEDQRCCGALHAHAGDAATARALARENIAAFEASGATFIAVNSAGCGAMCKGYGHLLQDDRAWAARAAKFAARVRDVHELLHSAAAAVGEEQSRSALSAGALPTSHSPALRIGWDAPCHLQHGQRVVNQPVDLLRSIPGATVTPIAGCDQCCGSAGIFSLLEPDVAAKVLAPKLDSIRAARVDVLATANPGCLMQIGGGLIRAGVATPCRHPVELLDEAHAPDRVTR